MQRQALIDRACMKHATMRLKVRAGLRMRMCNLLLQRETWIGISGNIPYLPYLTADREREQDQLRCVEVHPPPEETQFATLLYVCRIGSCEGLTTLTHAQRELRFWCRGEQAGFSRIQSSISSSPYISGIFCPSCALDDGETLMDVKHQKESAL